MIIRKKYKTGTFIYVTCLLGLSLISPVVGMICIVINAIIYYFDFRFEMKPDEPDRKYTIGTYNELYDYVLKKHNIRLNYYDLFIITENYNNKEYVFDYMYDTLAIIPDNGVFEIIKDYNKKLINE